MLQHHCHVYIKTNVGLHACTDTDTVCFIVILDCLIPEWTTKLYCSSGCVLYFYTTLCFKFGSNAFSYWRGPCLKQVRGTNIAFQRSLLSIVQNWNEHGKKFRMGANLLASTCSCMSAVVDILVREVPNLATHYTDNLLYCRMYVCQSVLMGKNRGKNLKRNG